MKRSCLQSCNFIIDGKMEKAILGQCLTTLTPDITTHVQPLVQQQGKIHSYLFSNVGLLLQANEAATSDWKSRGTTKSAPWGTQ